MIKITNISGLLILLYLWYHQAVWNISPNEQIIISSFIVNIIQKMSSTLISILMIILGIIYLYSILTSKIEFWMYLLSLMLFGIVSKISISTLMLEDTTTFVLFKVQHISETLLVLKKNYFNSSLIENVFKKKTNSGTVVENVPILRVSNDSSHHLNEHGYPQDTEFTKEDFHDMKKTETNPLDDVD